MTLFFCNTTTKDYDLSRITSNKTQSSKHGEIRFVRYNDIDSHLYWQNGRSEDGPSISFQI